MGGQKKPTISKLKKMLEGKKRKSDREEVRKVEYGVIIDEATRKELIGFIKSSKYVTPSMVSRKAEIKISEARRFLKELENQGMIRLELKNRELEVYVPVKAA